MNTIFIMIQKTGLINGIVSDDFVDEGDFVVEGEFKNFKKASIMYNVLSQREGKGKVGLAEVKDKMGNKLYLLLRMADFFNHGNGKGIMCQNLV